MKYSLVPLSIVFSRVRRHPLLEDVPEEALVDYAYEFIGLVELAEMYDDRLAVLDVKDYRAPLPPDFVSVVQVRTMPGPGRRPPIVLRTMTDTFYKSAIWRHPSTLAYKIQGRVLFTSVPVMKLEVAYRALPVDECGLPMVPDNAKFLRAMEEYIKYKAFRPLYDMGKIQAGVMERAEQDYCWAVAACESEFKLPAPDEMETLANWMTSFAPKGRQVERGYADAGDPELIRNHRGN